MEKNISIKVSYQKTNRRFAIAKNAKWSELETSIRTLYSFPPTFSFALTYTDEDSDIITLRSDLELQEILSQPHSSTLKFTIVPYEIENKDIESNIDKGIESNIDKGIESSIGKGIESSIIESSIDKDIENNISKDNNFSKDDKYNKSNDINKGNKDNDISNLEVEEIDQLSQYFSKQHSSNQSPYDEQNHQEEQTSKPPFIDLAAQFQKLIDQFRPLIEQHPRLIEQANNVMDQILHNIPVDLEMWTQWFKDQIADIQRNFRDVKANISDEENINIFDEIQRFAQNAVQSGQSIAQNAVQSGQSIAQNARKWSPPWIRGDFFMTEEEINEKLTSLRSMGFRNDKENEELLKKYYGNVEKVVEILLSEQNDSEYTFVDNEVQMEDL
ncbi:10912_t:CDS:2 [Diversispora eburnea]|uniref:10912_t:CDS:1 n=1 Tax=Diversispora eburnea TaxID=1213867 RepID=A0A9N8V0G9_9GLOM|nr:10912_t:CDS:2 [Diversispora eburnea]